VLDLAFTTDGQLIYGVAKAAHSNIRRAVTRSIAILFIFRIANDIAIKVLLLLLPSPSFYQYC